MKSQKIYSFLLALILAFPTSFSVPLYAERVSPEALPKVSPLGVDSVRLPSGLGKIQKVFRGTQKTSVILIQDAHAVPDAQRSIRGIIDFFQKTQGLRLVATEGAASHFDPFFFRTFPDKEILRKIFEAYQAKGELTGATAASVFNETSAVYSGIEDWALYEEGLRLYLKALGEQPVILERIKVLQEDLERRKKEIYSEKLLSLDRQLRNFEEKKNHLPDVLLALARIKPPLKGSEVDLLLQEIRKENTSQKSLESEVKKIAFQINSSLQSYKLPKDELFTFHQKFQDFQTSQLGPEAFGLYLRELSERIGLSFSISQKLMQGIEAQRKIRHLEGTDFFRKFNRYSRSVKNSIFRNEEERKLDRENEQLSLFNRLAGLELTREDWRKIKATPSSSLTLSPEIFSSHLAFYENTQKRDEALFRNLISLMKENRIDSSLLVAGGFHSEGLAQKLEKQGISYLLVSPEINAIPHDSSYSKQMRGEVSWKDYFQIENGKVSLSKAFIRSTRDKLLKENTDPALLKNWRDQIIRELVKQEKVTQVGKYTAYLDEILTDELKPGWQIKMEKLIQSLGELNSRGQWTKQEILKVLPSAVVSAPPANSLAERSDIRASLLPVLNVSPPPPRAEARAEARGKRDPKQFVPTVELLEDRTLPAAGSLSLEELLRPSLPLPPIQQDTQMVALTSEPQLVAPHVPASPQGSTAFFQELSQALNASFTEADLIDKIQNEILRGVSLRRLEALPTGHNHLVAAVAEELSYPGKTHVFIYSTDGRQLLRTRHDAFYPFKGLKIDDTAQAAIIFEGTTYPYPGTLSIYRLGQGQDPVLVRPIDRTGQNVKIIDEPGEPLGIEVYPNPDPHPKTAGGMRLILNIRPDGVFIASENSHFVPQEALQEFPQTRSNPDIRYTERVVWDEGISRTEKYYDFYRSNGDYVTSITKEFLAISTSYVNVNQIIGEPDFTPDGRYLVSGHFTVYRIYSSKTYYTRKISISDTFEGGGRTITLQEGSSDDPYSFFEDDIESIHLIPDSPYTVGVSYVSGDSEDYDVRTGVLIERFSPPGARAFRARREAFERGYELVQSLVPETKLQLPPLDSPEWNFSVDQKIGFSKLSFQTTLDSQPVSVEITVGYFDRQLYGAEISFGDGEAVGVRTIRYDTGAQVAPVIYGRQNHLTVVEEPYEALEPSQRHQLAQRWIGILREGRPLWHETYDLRVTEGPVEIVARSKDGISRDALEIAAKVIRFVLNDLELSMEQRLYEHNQTPGNTPIRLILTPNTRGIGGFPELMGMEFHPNILGITFNRFVLNFEPLEGLLGIYLAQVPVEDEGVSSHLLTYGFGRAVSRWTWNEALQTIPHEFIHILQSIGFSATQTQELLVRYKESVLGNRLYWREYASTNRFEFGAETGVSYVGLGVPTHRNRVELINYDEPTVLFNGTLLAASQEDPLQPDLNPIIKDPRNIWTVLRAALPKDEGVRFKFVNGSKDPKGALMTRARINAIVSGRKIRLVTEVRNVVIPGSQNTFELSISNGTSTISVVYGFVRQNGKVDFIYQIEIASETHDILSMPNDKIRLMTFGDLIQRVLFPAPAPPHPTPKPPPIPVPSPSPITPPTFNRPPFTFEPVRISNRPNNANIITVLFLYDPERDQTLILRPQPFMEKTPMQSFKGPSPLHQTTAQALGLHLNISSISGAGASSYPLASPFELLEQVAAQVSGKRPGFQAQGDRIQIMTPQGKVEVKVTRQRAEGGYWEIRLQTPHASLIYLMDSSGNLIAVNGEDLSSLPPAQKFEKIQKAVIFFLRDIGFLGDQDSMPVSEETLQGKEEGFPKLLLSIVGFLGFFVERVPPRISGRKPTLRSEARSVKKWLVRVGIPAAVVSMVVGGYYAFRFAQQPPTDEKELVRPVKPQKEVVQEPAQEREPVENVNVLLQKLKEENPEKRRQAAEGIQKIIKKKKENREEILPLVTALIEAITKSDHVMIDTHLRLLTDQKDLKIIKKGVAIVDAEVLVLEAVQNALVEAGDASISPLIKFMQENAEISRTRNAGPVAITAATHVLMDLKAGQAVPVMIKILTDERDRGAIQQDYFYATLSVLSGLKVIGDERAIPVIVQILNREVKLRGPDGDDQLGGGAVNGLTNLFGSGKIKDPKLKLQVIQALTNAAVKTPRGIGRSKKDILKTFQDQLKREADKSVRGALESAIKQIEPKEEKPSRSEVRSVEGAGNTAPIIRRKISPAVMKNFEGSMAKALLSRFETLGRTFQAPRRAEARATAQTPLDPNMLPEFFPPLTFTDAQLQPLLHEMANVPERQAPNNQTFYDLQALRSLAASLNPGFSFLNGIPDAQLQNADAEMRKRLLYEISWEIFIRSNRLLESVADPQTRQRSFLIASILPASLSENAVMTRTSPLRVRIQNSTTPFQPGITGRASGRLAFLDPDRARERAQPDHQKQFQNNFRTNAARPPTQRSPFLSTLQDALVAGGISGNDPTGLYGHYFGEFYWGMEEFQHARDFAEAQENNPSIDLRFEPQELNIMAKAILRKPTPTTPAPLDHFFDQGMARYQNLEEQELLVSMPILEFSGQLGGLRRRMEELISLGNAEVDPSQKERFYALAYAAFYHFWVIQRFNMLQPLGQTTQPSHRLAAFIATDTLSTVLKHLSNLPGFETFVVNQLQQGTQSYKERAEKARKLIDEIDRWAFVDTLTRRSEVRSKLAELSSWAQRAESRDFRKRSKVDWSLWSVLLGGLLFGVFIVSYMMDLGKGIGQKKSLDQPKGKASPGVRKKEIGEAQDEAAKKGVGKKARKNQAAAQAIPRARKSKAPDLIKQVQTAQKELISAQMKLKALEVEKKLLLQRKWNITDREKKKRELEIEKQKVLKQHADGYQKSIALLEIGQARELLPPQERKNVTQQEKDAIRKSYEQTVRNVENNFREKMKAIDQEVPVRLAEIERQIREIAKTVEKQTWLVKLSILKLNRELDSLPRKKSSPEEKEARITQLEESIGNVQKALKRGRERLATLRKREKELLARLEQMPDVEAERVKILKQQEEELDRNDEAYQAEFQTLERNWQGKEAGLDEKLEEVREKYRKLAEAIKQRYGVRLPSLELTQGYKAMKELMEAIADGEFFLNLWRSELDREHAAPAEARSESRKNDPELENGPRRSEIRQVANQVIERYRAMQVPDYRPDKAAETLARSEYRVVRTIFDVVIQKRASRKAVQSAQRGVRSMDALWNLKGTILVEHRIDISRAPDPSTVINHLLQAAHDTSLASRGKVTTRIILSAPVRNGLGFLDHHEEDPVSLQILEKTIVVGNPNSPKFAKAFTLAADITVTSDPRFEGPAVLTDRLHTGEAFPYRGAGGEWAEARAYTAAVMKITSSKTETAGLLVWFGDEAMGKGRIASLRALEELGIMGEIMSQFRAELRLKQAA